MPIYQTTSFVFEDVEDAADLFALQKYGNIYSRLGNPTVAAFEERVASLEGGIGAVATGSGQAAETLLFTSLCSAGDHVVSSSALYGGTYTLLDVTLRRLGIETTFVPADDPAAFAAAIEPGRTKLLYTEIIANPAGTVADLEALGEAAHAAGIPFVVDATLATPTSAARSSTAPTSCCTRRPSSSAATAPRSAAWSSTPASSRGTTATSRS